MNSNALPFITIIVAVYNGAKTLQKCIESIVRQKYPHSQLIIIDGNSTDTTVDILKLNNEHISYWVSEPDDGIYSAWNKGLKHASGDWVCFLGADDYFWEPESLLKMATYLMSAPSKIRVVYANVVLVNQNNKQIMTVGAPWNEAKTIFTELMSIPHCGAMHKKSLFTDHGNFNETFRIAGDYEFLLRELKNSDALFAENVIIAGMLQGGISGNPMGMIKQLREVRAAQKLNGYSKPSWRWIFAYTRSCIRALLWRLLGERNAKVLMDFIRTIIGKPKFWTKT